MARRMTLEGAKVHGLRGADALFQRLEPGISSSASTTTAFPFISHTITDIQGDRRVEKVIISKVDENRKPIPGSGNRVRLRHRAVVGGPDPGKQSSPAGWASKSIPAPTARWSMRIWRPPSPAFSPAAMWSTFTTWWTFVTAESKRAGGNAAKYILSEGIQEGKLIQLKNGDNVGYTVPRRSAPEMWTNL